MTLTQEFETLFFIIFASMISITALILVHNNPFHHTPVVAPLPHFALVAAIPAGQIPLGGAFPTPTTPPAPKTTTSSQTSSDGTMTMTLKTTSNPNLSTTYLLTASKADGTTTTLSVMTIPGISTMTIPFNVFSPNNTYAYLKETIGSETHYLVFKSLGDPFSNGQYSLDVAPAFATYTSQYSLSDVTGWADDGLLVVNTKKADGTGGPSYWYEVSSHSFIPLATVFE